MLRGVERHQESNPGLLLRDTRNLGQRVGDFFKNRIGVTMLLVALMGGAYFLPALNDLILLIGVSCFIYTFTRKQMLPFRLPRQAGMKDYNDLTPGIKKPNDARGITYFGNDGKTKEELWFHNEDMRTHVLIFGATGSGKTEALVSMAYNALIQGSGFIYVDGKGDNSLYAKVFSLARSMGREDDLLLINFMTGARDIVGPQESRLSNTLNPFATGSSSMLAQLVISMMESSAQTPDGDMWKGRAISFVEALMKILVYMRDQGAVLLDANSVRNYFHLTKLEAIVLDHQFPRDEEEAVSLEDVPDIVLEPIRNYVLNLPGYNKEKKGKQVTQVLEQHGFVTMQLTRVFTSLADTYGHILRTKLAEVDFKDVVLNRRILVVLLPALEKSPEELSNLGKIIVASLKAMMASGLGENVEGEYQDIISRKPTNAPTPYLCILDEYGYYAVQGFAVVPAQARSLGFSVVFAGQDYPAFQKASKEEAASIGANTNIKIAMKIEDPTETWDFFMKSAGEAYVTKVDAFQTKDTSISNSYLDTKSSSFEKRARIDLLDLKDQTEGEAHIFFRSTIVRARMFYANPKPVKTLKINQFIKVDALSDKIVHDMRQRLKTFKGIMEKGEVVIEDLASENEDIAFLTDIFRNSEGKAPIDRGFAVLQAFQDRAGKDIEAEVETFEEEVISGELNIFNPLQAGKSIEPLLVSDKASFAQPLIMLKEVHPRISTIEKLAGKADKYAFNIANEIVKDMKFATHYPPSTLSDISASDLTASLQELIGRIQQARTEAQKKET
ncbi:MAG: TraM recognition domain-containing protein [Gammaproteobacteria bacterium]